MESIKMAPVRKSKTDQGYLNLQAAILEQAGIDYEIAIFFGNTGEARRLKRWFSSSWAQELTNGNGKEMEQRIAGETKAMLALIKIIKDNLLITNIEATPEKVKTLKKKYCKFQIDKNGCFTFKTYRSFKRALRIWKEAEREAKKPNTYDWEESED